MGKSEYLTSYALKSAIMYKSLIDFDHELQFILYIFIHFVKSFDQTCMPTYFLTKINVWKNILEHRTHYIWGSHFLCDIIVRRQPVENIGNFELRRRYPAWNSAIVLEFWRWMMILLIVVFPRLSHQRILKKSLNWLSILIPIAAFIIWTNLETGSWIGCSRRLSMTC